MALKSKMFFYISLATKFEMTRYGHRGRHVRGMDKGKPFRLLTTCSAEKLGPSKFLSVGWVPSYPRNEIRKQLVNQSDTSIQRKWSWVYKGQVYLCEMDVCSLPKSGIANMIVIKISDESQAAEPMSEDGWTQVWPMEKEGRKKRNTW